MNIELSKKKSFDLSLFNKLALIFIIFSYFRCTLGIPIQEELTGLSHFILVIDKYIIVSFFLIIFLKRLITFFFCKEWRGFGKNIKTDVVLKNELYFLGFFLLFLMWGLVSAAVNSNSIKTTMFGIFAYIVYFLVFFIFSSIPFKRGAVKYIYKILLNLVLILCGISIFQEIFALLYPASTDWWVTFQSGDALWRSGIFRASSLLHHANTMGIVTLFFWTIELSQSRHSESKSKDLKLFLLMTGIILTVSKVAMASALIAVILLVPKKRKKAILAIPFILILGVIFILAIIGGTEKASPQRKKIKPVYDNIYIIGHDRLYALKKSFEIVKHNPIFGVGPGMYGGHVSIKYNSPVYEDYGFSPLYINYIKKMGTIEQFYGHVSVELGIPGLIFVLLLIFCPILIIRNILIFEKDIFLRRLLMGMIIFPIQTLVLGLSCIVTHASEWLFLYFALLGMIVGFQRRKN